MISKKKVLILSSISNFISIKILIVDVFLIPVYRYTYCTDKSGMNYAFDDSKNYELPCIDRSHQSSCVEPDFLL